MGLRGRQAKLEVQSGFTRFTRGHGNSLDKTTTLDFQFHEPHETVRLVLINSIVSMCVWGGGEREEEACCAARSEQRLPYPECPLVARLEDERLGQEHAGHSYEGQQQQHHLQERGGGWHANIGFESQGGRLLLPHASCMERVQGTHALGALTCPGHPRPGCPYLYRDLTWSPQIEPKAHLQRGH